MIFADFFRLVSITCPAGGMTTPKMWASLVADLVAEDETEDTREQDADGGLHQIKHVVQLLGFNEGIDF